MSRSSIPGGTPDGNLTALLELVDQLQPAIAEGNRARIKDLVGQLVAHRAPMGGQWHELARITALFGELSLARQAIDLFVEQSGGTDAARYQKATLLAESGAFAEADALMRELPETVPDPVGNAYSRGMIALNLGRRDEARQYMEWVTQARPHVGSAWLTLAMTADFAAEPALAERLMAAGRDIERAPAPHRAAYHYAVGKAHDDRGEHAMAFGAYTRGAREMKAVAVYDRDADRRQAEEAVRGFSAERISSVASKQREPTRPTIFVTGLPRSGTTLVEQVLTSHSAIGDGAEFGGLGLLAIDIGGRSWPVLENYVEREGVSSARRLWDHLLAERFLGSRGVVDKAMDTSRLIGLAAALLPEAPLIWITRNRLDCAWSCFRTNFLGSAIPWSYDLEDIAFHFRLEDQLLAQWQEILGERLLVVPHEELVAEPQTWIRRLLGHCGLAEEPQVFAPHENQRAVSTASMMQVRKPINNAGIGSAESYREFLQPFIDAYYR